MAKQSTTDAGRTEKRSAPPAAPTPNSTAESTDIDADQRRERIATAAYYRAERRNFEGNAEMDDWLEAEREIDSATMAGGIQAEASRREEGPDDVSAPALKAEPHKDDPDFIAPDDVQRWAAQLGVSATTLRVAIERVGPRVPEVRRFLEQHQRDDSR